MDLSRSLKIYCAVKIRQGIQFKYWYIESMLGLTQKNKWLLLTQYNIVLTTSLTPMESSTVYVDIGLGFTSKIFP